MLAAATLFAALAAPAGAVPQSPGDTVVYSVAPVMEGAGLAALAVEIRFRGDADGETRLELPAEWAGADELWRHLGDVEVDGATTVRATEPAVRMIAHRPGATLTARYRVRSAYEAEPGREFAKGRPVVRPGWFFFHGESVFARPELREDAPARFAWRSVPAGWKMASDLDHVAASGRGSVRDVVESAAIGAPDLVVVERVVDGAPLRVASRGAWSFTPQAFADALERIVATTNQVWGDRAQPFVALVAPLQGEVLSAHGTSRGDAFSVVSTAAMEMSWATRFLGHEYLHSWIAPQLGGLPAEDQTASYWLSEGFTDFYAPRIMVQAGLWTPAQYAEELNGVLLRTATSPARAATAADVAARFWTDRDVQQLPYDRGHLLAHVLEGRIRAATGGRTGLHDVLLAQREQARANAAAGRTVYAHDLFLAMLRERTGIDFAPEVAAHVTRGEPIRLPAETFGACASVASLTQPEFHRGFDLAATERAGGVLAGVDPALPAHAAGLRDGMRLVRREAGRPGDATVEYAYRVQDAAGERVVRYLPQGLGTVAFQRVTLAPASAGCTWGIGSGAGALTR